MNDGVAVLTSRVGDEGVALQAAKVVSEGPPLQASKVANQGESLQASKVPNHGAVLHSSTVDCAALRAHTDLPSSSTTITMTLEAWRAKTSLASVKA